ncbi:MAG TPA: gluconate 2-dehydrogenase subunit 3 family protein [Gemmatimonadales bacterium]|nr:gluconate 2-dehydrogenase subunit 3 family protein [Gemmatimonadales bacterium]
MTDLTRREALQGLAASVGALAWTPADVRRAVQALRAVPAQAYSPKFFTTAEWNTVRILVDLIIPRDARSGSATDAGVPEFMDFMLTENTGMQTPMRGGLAWLDAECRERFGKIFADCAEAERRAVLDEVAWPAKARPELSHGVAFFSRFRDLTASGFWSSEMGTRDLRYMGNTAVPEWKGCPPEQLARLGLS